MAGLLLGFAVLMVVLTLGSTLVAIWSGAAQAGQLIELSRILISWPVIAGGLVMGARREILRRVSGGQTEEPPRGPSARS